MLTNLKRLILTTAAALTLSLGLLPIAVAHADTKGDVQCGVNAAAGGDCNTPTGGAGDSIHDTLASIINILSLIIGIAAVIVIIIAGFNYITAGGDDARVSSAKKAIINAVIGLIIVGAAQLIVQLVINGANGGNLTQTNCPAGQQLVNGQCVTPHGL